MKKVFFALFAVVIAIGGSAFTNAKVAAVGTTYGSDISDYHQLTVPYNNLSCLNEETKTCAYQVTEAGKLIVTQPSYSDAQMASFLIAGYIQVAPGSRTGLYDF